LLDNDQLEKRHDEEDRQQVAETLQDRPEKNT
jgi:hypothetical protein